MTAQPDRPITIHLSPRQAEQAEFLTGLEAWLQLGLLSDAQVRQLCQEHLTCAVPESEGIPGEAESPLSQPSVSSPALAAVREEDSEEPDFSDRARVRSSRRSPLAADRLERWFQAFMAEISVIWLLFLGVFLVVVSSGVLAASQWQNFPPIGQYGILLTYTLAFFGAGIWTGRRETLRLTARMLQITTLLIIPINFWMIDGLNLWQTLPGGTVALIAGLILSGLTIFLLRSPLALIPRHALKLVTLNYLVLCWLHWGWSFSSFPLVATYIGTVSTAVLMAIQAPIAPAATILAAATLLLIGRATLLSQVPIAQLGLALGLCGWVFCWVRRPSSSVDAVAGARRDRSLWGFAGVGLLGLGWLVSVGESPPLQAFAVSGLGLWLLFDRLQRTERGSTLTALLLVGLQTYGLLWRILPMGVQTAILTTATQLLGDTAQPFVLLGLAFFPYLWLCLRLTPSTLTRQTEWFALVWGGSMTLISLLNPGVRSLNLLLSALTLGGVIRKRAIVPAMLIYLAHGTALAAVLSGIDWGFPALSPIAWARTLLVLMAIEWLWCLTLEDSWWRRSAWHLGLGLAGLSYTLLLPTYIGVVSAIESYQNLIWLSVPVLLTGLSRLQRFWLPSLAAWFSIGALGLHLGLIGTLDSWIISLTIAVGVMLVNASTLRHLVAVVLTVGFALALEGAIVWRLGSEQLTIAAMIMIASLTLWGLWLIRDGLTRQPTPMRTLYATAIDGWATLLGGLLLLIMPLLSLTEFSLQELPTAALIGAGLTVGAMTYRLWQQPTELGFCGLGGAIESLLVMLVVRLGGTLTDWAIGNLGLGLLAQLVADGWVARTGQTYRKSWHLIPLIYATLGLLAAHTTFTAFTGLYTLAAALVGIGVGRRQGRFRLLTVLSLVGVSIAAYELLIYQLLQVEGGRPGDGIALLAGLAALIAWLYRLLSPWLLPYLRLTPPQLKAIAHLHWVVGSLLSLFALTTSLSPFSTVLLIGIALSLTAYALSLGRHPHSSIQ
ncbi:hypothetical protein [Egbenema bharatensis]|uniref:hypothetical protein n=1 Tax=Egbenema bharatensis TaxID=3463334 RepID=UPI003A8780B2